MIKALIWSLLNSEICDQSKADYDRFVFKLADFVGWVTFNPTMRNDTLIAGYCVPTQSSITDLVGIW